MPARLCGSGAGLAPPEASRHCVPACRLAGTLLVARGCTHAPAPRAPGGTTRCCRAPLRPARSRSADQGRSGGGSRPAPPRPWPAAPGAPPAHRPARAGGPGRPPTLRSIARAAAATRGKARTARARAGRMAETSLTGGSPRRDRAEGHATPAPAGALPGAIYAVRRGECGRWQTAGAVQRAVTRRVVPTEGVQEGRVAAPPPPGESGATRAALCFTLSRGRA